MAALPDGDAARIREERIVALAERGYQAVLDAGVAGVEPEQAAYSALQVQAIADEIQRLKAL